MHAGRHCVFFLISFLLKMVNKLFLRGINPPFYDSVQFNERFNGISVCLRKQGEESPLASSCFQSVFFYLFIFLLGSKTSPSQRKSRQNINLSRKHELAKCFSSLWSVVTHDDGTYLKGVSVAALYLRKRKLIQFETPLKT